MLRSRDPRPRRLLVRAKPASRHRRSTRTDEQPIGLAYVCGNRFLVTSSLRMPSPSPSGSPARTRRAPSASTGAAGGPGSQRGGDRDAARDGRAAARRHARLARAENGGVPVRAGHRRRRARRWRRSRRRRRRLEPRPSTGRSWRCTCTLLPERAGAVLRAWQGDAADLEPGDQRLHRGAEPRPALLRRPCVPRGRPAAGRGRAHRGPATAFPTSTSTATAGGWQSAAPMARGRWYPTATTMAERPGGDPRRRATRTASTCWCPRSGAPAQHHGADRRQPLLALLPARRSSRRTDGCSTPATGADHPLPQHHRRGQVDHRRQPQVRRPRLRLGRDVRAGQDPLRRRRAHHQHGGDDRSQR